jgi:hypothetical protein
VEKEDDAPASTRSETPPGTTVSATRMPVPPPSRLETERVGRIAPPPVALTRPAAAPERPPPPAPELRALQTLERLPLPDAEQASPPVPTRTTLPFSPLEPPTAAEHNETAEAAPEQPAEPVEEPEHSPPPVRRGPEPIGAEIFADLELEPLPSVPRLTRPSGQPRASLPAAPRSYTWLGEPVFAVNRAFDWATYWLGGLGRWLREPGGRQALGWVGIGLLLAAAAWQVLLWMEQTK